MNNRRSESDINADIKEIISKLIENLEKSKVTKNLGRDIKSICSDLEDADQKQLTIIIKNVIAKLKPHQKESTVTDALMRLERFSQSSEESEKAVPLGKKSLALSNSSARESAEAETAKDDIKENKLKALGEINTGMQKLQVELESYCATKPNKNRLKLAEAVIDNIKQMMSEIKMLSSQINVGQEELDIATKAKKIITILDNTEVELKDLRIRKDHSGRLGPLLEKAKTEFEKIDKIYVPLDIKPKMEALLGVGSTTKMLASFKGLKPIKKEDSKAKFSHVVFTAAKHNKDKVFYLKTIDSAKLYAAYAEVIGQEVLRMLMPWQPKTRLVLAKQGDKLTYSNGETITFDKDTLLVASEEIKGCKDPSALTKDGKANMIAIANTYESQQMLAASERVLKDFGQAICGMWRVAETDFKEGHVLVTPEGQFFNIDGDHKGIAARRRKNFSNAVTTNDYDNLPLVEDFKPFNWQGVYREGVYGAPDSSVLSLIDNPQFLQEKHRMALKILLMPDEALQKLIDVHIPDKIKAKEIYLFEQQRANASRLAIMQSGAFQAYLQTPDALVEKEKFKAMLTEFKIVEKVHLYDVQLGDDRAESGEKKLISQVDEMMSKYQARASASLAAVQVLPHDDEVESKYSPS